MIAAVRATLILASLGFLAYLMRNVNAVFMALADVALTPVLLASLILLIALVWTAFLWTRLVGYLARGYPRPSTRQLFRSFSRSWVARYLPGTAWTYGTRAVYTDSAEVPARILATALIDELILVIVTTAALGAGFWVWSVAGVIVGVAALTMVFGLAIFVAMKADRITQFVLLRVGGVLARRWKRVGQELSRVAEAPALGLKGASLFSLGYGLISLSGGMAFALLAATLGSVSLEDLPVIIGGYNLALFIGMLAVFAPAGVGVRDALLAAFLSPVVTAPVAAFAAIAFRALTIVVDLLFFVFIELVTVGRAQVPPRVSDVRERVDHLP